MSLRKENELNQKRARLLRETGYDGEEPPYGYGSFHEPLYEPDWPECPQCGSMNTDHDEEFELNRCNECDYEC